MNARQSISLLIRLLYVAGVVAASLPWWKSGADYARGVCVVGYIALILMVVSLDKALIPTTALSVAMLIFLGIVGLTNNPRMSHAGRGAGMAIEGIKYILPITLIFSPIVVHFSRCICRASSCFNEHPSEPKKLDESTALLIKVLIVILLMCIGLVSCMGLISGSMAAPD